MGEDWTAWRNFIIAVTLPDLHATLPVADRNALQWAGVTTSLLRTSFHDAIYAVLRELFPRDTWRVEVREGLDHPAFSIESGAKVSSEKLSWAVHLAATCWVASVRHISIMRHRAAQG